MTVKRPAADLVSDHVFDEEDAAVEAERQPVEQLDILQKVVVRVAKGSKEAMKKCNDVYQAVWPPARGFIENNLVI